MKYLKRRNLNIDLVYVSFQNYQMTDIATQINCLYNVRTIYQGKVVNAR